MKVRRLRRDVLAMLISGPLLLGSARTVGAQPAGQTGPSVAHSFDELMSRIQPGATIFVTDSAGHEVRGRLSDLTDTFLNLVVDGKPRAFSQADVGLIEHRQPDSLWNGLLIGVAAGAAPAVYWLLADPNECGGSICMDDLAVGVIPGAAIGLVIDAVIKRKVVVYRSASKSSMKTAVSIAPIVVRRRRGVELTMSF